MIYFIVIVALIVALFYYMSQGTIPNDVENNEELAHEKDLGALHKAWICRVVKVTYTNEDGQDRQTIIKKCKTGSRVDLIYDIDTIIVEYIGDAIGELSSEDFDRVKPLLDAGMLMSGEINQKFGGTKEKPTRGLTVEVAIYK